MAWGVASARFCGGRNRMQERLRIRFSGLLVMGWVIFCCALASMGSAEQTEIPSGPYGIAGTVVNAKAGTPLARCRVTVTDSKNRQRVQFAISGDDGRFKFHVPAGKCSLEGAKR